MPSPGEDLTSAGHPAPGGEAGLIESVRTWTSAMLDTGVVSLSHNEAQALFADLARRLADALEAPEFDPEPCAHAGAQLVIHGFAGPQALTRTLYWLGSELAPLVERRAAAGDGRITPERLAAVQARLAESYLSGARERPPRDQESSEDAALDARVQARRARAAGEAQFSAVFASADVGIAIGDIRDGTIVEVNQALENMLGRGKDELRGLSLQDLADDTDGARRVQDGLGMLKSGELSRYRTQISLREPEDEPKNVKVALTLVSDSEHETAYPVMVLSDVTDMHLIAERLSYQSVHDALTGLPNKSRLVTYLERTLAEAAKAGEHIGLCFLDIDGFKVIQDGLGAHVGDRVLQSVAHRLRQVFSAPDMLVARLTGDGFGVVVGGNRGQHELTGLVDEALRELAEPVYFDDHGVSISASVAVVVQPAADYSPTELIRAAEITVHRAKYDGKAQWMLFDPELDTRDRARYRLGAGIGGALENGELALEFQPLLRLDTQEDVLYAAYASPRWDHPEQGLLYAEQFAPVAVETGLMVPAGRWLLQQGCRQATEWQAAFGSAAPPVRLRLPERLMRDEDLVGYVMHELESSTLDPAQLHIQLPPTAVVDRAGDALDSVEILREHGLGFVLEATGTAELDLLYRLELPVNGIHLRGDQVRAISAEPGMDSLPARNAAHLITQARALGLAVTAEGVSTGELAYAMHELGVTAASGMFTDKAQPTTDIRSLISRVPTP